MAQQMVARVNRLIYDPGGAGKTVEFKKVYKDSGGTWRLAGDGNPDDPGGAVTINLSQGAASTLDSNWYNYYGEIEETYTYSLYINSVLQDSQIGEPLIGIDLVQYIASNRTHAIGDGSDHSHVALNDAHRILISGNPHSVVKGDVGLGNVENKNAATIISEITDSDIEALGFNSNNQAYIYQETFTGVTSKDMVEADINSYLSLPTDWYVAPNINVEFWTDVGSGVWDFIAKTNISISEQSINGVTCLQKLAVTGLSAGTRYKMMIVVPIVYAPAP